MLRLLCLHLHSYLLRVEHVHAQVHVTERPGTDLFHEPVFTSGAAYQDFRFSGFSAGSGRHCGDRHLSLQPALFHSHGTHDRHEMEPLTASGLSKMSMFNPHAQFTFRFIPYVDTLYSTFIIIL